jgi:protein TonB
MSLVAAMQGTPDSIGLAMRPEHRRLFAITLAASVVLHLAAIAIAPRINRPEAWAPPPLQVVLVQPPVPRPMRVEPPPPPPRRERTVAKPEPQARRTPPVKPQPAPERKPVIALPESAAPAQPSFTVAQPSVEPTPAPESKPKAIAAPPSPPAPPRETVVTTEPVYNAAYLGNAKPRYPLIARRNGVEGTVLVKVLVSKEGRAAKVELERSSGSGALDTAALDAVKSWRFTPARRGQENVDMPYVVPVVFKLEGTG